MTDEEFWKGFELTRDEINVAIYSYYTWLEILNYAATNREILNSINRTPSFWNVTLHGLQESFFMALGRIFDDGKDCHSIHKFISSCISHPEHFLYDALEKRKQGGSEKPDWLDNYMRQTYQPTVSDFGKIKQAIVPHRKKFDYIYKDIRNYVFGHNIAHKLGTTSDLFKKTKIGDLEEILYFLYDLQSVIWELFYNGTKPDLGVRKYDYKDRISSEARQAMNALICKVDLP